MLKVALTTGIFLSYVAGAAQSQQSTSSSNAQRVTVTGCVERATTRTPGATVGTTGTIGSVTPDTTFILTTRAPGTANTTATVAPDAPSDSALNAQYRLDDPDETRTASHEGHQVKITGVVEDPARATAGAPASTPAAAMHAPKLKVESIVMIAASCSEQY
jgi:hypothetical protein